jgi:hypothetical protein
VWIVALIVLAIARPRRFKDRIAWAGGLLVVLGFVSFASNGAAGWLPSSIEWPIGLAGDVLTTPSGIRVVGHDAADRVQIYDANWCFLRGWPIDAHGGVFRIAILPDDQVEVITARGDTRFVFDLNGRELSRGPAPKRAPPSFEHISLGTYVPTWPWLWTLTTPFLGFVAIILGIALAALSGRVKFNQRGTSIFAPRSPPPVGGGHTSMRCPACDDPIRPEDINVQADTALCRSCGHATSYSVIVHAPIVSVHSAPPDGCDVQEHEGRWRAVASTRSWRAIPLGIMAIFWNGIVFTFAGSLFFAVPGATKLLVILLAGHLAAGMFVAWTAFCYAFGDVEVVIENGEVSVGTGAGPLRIPRRRALTDIRGIRQDTRPRSPFGTHVLVLDAPKPLKFGGFLKDERRYFLYAAIAARLRRVDGMPAPSPTREHVR